MRAAATLYEPGGPDVRDVQLGAATLWTLRTRRNHQVYTVPDLSWDVVWLPGAQPLVSPRTVAGFSTALSSGDSVVGIRFPPAVVAVDLDSSWLGWRCDPTQDRRAVLRRALTEGAVRAEVGSRLAGVLASLNRPRLRVASVAAELGISGRQLQRWTTEATGLTPKQIHRHLRVRRFWELDRQLPLAHRAIEAGYYDQAHASTEIKAITGLSPLELTRFSMSDSYKTADPR